VIIEGDSENGSKSLEEYIEALKTRIGSPSLVVSLKSGIYNYHSLQITSSLRGTVNGVLTVKVAEKVTHSGECGGIIPSGLNVVRTLLDRIENAETGEIIKELQVIIPSKSYENGVKTAKALKT